MTETHLKLGKLPATEDRRDLLFADFLKPGVTLKEAPVGFGVSRTKNLKLKMLGNGPDDTLPTNWTAARQGAGDCVWADACNRVYYSNALAGRDVEVSGTEAIKMYRAETGYDPVSGANDNGTDMRQALNYARKVGILDAKGTRHKIGGYCALEAGNWQQMLQALDIFDVVSMGFEFPASAMNQFDLGKAWTYVKTSQIEGGHDVLVAARSSLTMGHCFTWANPTQRFTSGFYSHYVDEAYGIFLPESLKSGKSPEGFVLTDFKAALAEL